VLERSAGDFSTAFTATTVKLLSRNSRSRPEAVATRLIRVDTFDIDCHHERGGYDGESPSAELGRFADHHFFHSRPRVWSIDKPSIKAYG